MKSDFLVNNKFDYLLFRGSRYWGVVEAKRVGPSLVDAFVQCSHQLLLLAGQSETLVASPTNDTVDEGINNTNTTAASEQQQQQQQQHTEYPLCGVVTSGSKWVFVLLHQEALHVSEVYHVERRSELRRVVLMLSHLMRGNFPSSI